MWRSAWCTALCGASLAVAPRSVGAVEIPQIGADQAYAQHELAGLTDLPKCISPGPSFDVHNVIDGKSTLIIACGTNLSMTLRWSSGIKDAAEAVEYPTSIWLNRGNLSEY